MKNLRIVALLGSAFILISTCTPSRNDFRGHLKNFQPVSKELFDTIARMDSILFQAFNTCNIEGFTNLLTDDIEFYHDQGGLMLSSKTQSEGLKNRCAEQ